MLNVLDDGYGQLGLLFLALDTGARNEDHAALVGARWFFRRRHFQQAGADGRIIWEIFYLVVLLLAFLDEQSSPLFNPTFSNFPSLGFL